MKPNIIIVMTDQHRADLRRACGYPLDTMPFLDSWAQKGVDFGKAYTPNPTCMPARVSMFTGRYPECHKARTNHNAMDALYTKDLLDVLKEQGYVTALCGKNHSHRKPSDFDFFETNGHTGIEDNRKITEEEKRLDEFLHSLNHMEAYAPAPGGITVQQPYRNVSSALKFIDSIGQDQPFFAWVSFAEPHNPYQVPEPYFDMFPPEVLPEMKTSIDDLPAKGERFVWLRKVWERILGPDIDNRIQRVRSNYHGMLRLIDDQFKRLVEGIEERKLTENTIIIFTADHGDFVGEYGLIRKGADLPDVLTHIPMVWCGPGIAAQSRNENACVNLVDIFPSLCDLLGIKTPFGVQGKSIVPLLKQKEIPEEEFDIAYSENGFSGLYWTDEDHLDLIREGASQGMVTFDCLNTWTQSGQVRMIRKGNYKIQVDMMGTGYLYNLSDDPLEVNNLWNDPDYLKIKADMASELTAAILRAADPLPAPHHRYRTKIHPKGYQFQPYITEDPGVLNLPPLHRLLHNE